MTQRTGSNGVDRAYFGRRYPFSASHRLHTDALTADENLAAYGKCNNPHGHGHNYVLEVLVGGAVSAETGMVIDMLQLDRAVRDRILDRFDHMNLNMDPLFVNLVPTTENLCRVIAGLLHEAVTDVDVKHVRVEETENNFFQVSGG
jgi:6-pyruvoyltetrahydropterin/6-carboxytetrahydropterin synthase